MKVSVFRFQVSTTNRFQVSVFRCQKTEERRQKADDGRQNLIILEVFRLVLLTPET